MNESTQPDPMTPPESVTAFFARASKMREEIQRTEMRNWMIFLVMFTLCLQTVRGKAIDEPFYGICYGVAGFLTGAAVASKDKLNPKTP